MFGFVRFVAKAFMRLSETMLPNIAGTTSSLVATRAANCSAPLHYPAEKATASKDQAGQASTGECQKLNHLPTGNGCRLAQATRQRHAAAARVRHRNTAAYNSVVALATKLPVRHRRRARIRESIDRAAPVLNSRQPLQTPAWSRATS